MTITQATDIVPERQLRLCAAVQDVFAGLFGIAVDRVAPGATFLELGADSLMLLRAGQALRERFGVKVAFRRLMEDLATPADVAAYLAAALPDDGEQAGPQAALPVIDATSRDETACEAFVRDERVEAPAAALAVASVVASDQDDRGGPRSDVARVVAEQLRLMSRQLELLGARPHAKTRLVKAEDSPAENGDGPAKASDGPAKAGHYLRSGNGRQLDGANQLGRSVRLQPDPPTRPTFVPFAPLDRSAGASLTLEQRAYLDDLIDRVTRRTKRSKDLAQEFRRVLANNRASAGFRLLWKELVYPLAGHRGRGSHIWDVDGHEYIDLTMGFGALLYGHAPDFMQAALARQLELGIQIGPESETAGEAAALLCELTGAERATFCNSGTEAVMVALRLARTVTGRAKIALFAGSYHGTFDGVLAKGSRAADGTYTAVPMAPGVPASLIQDVVLLDYESFDALDVVKRIGPELAAVLVEPRQSRRPDLDRREFLQRLREITSQTGTALVFDEVVTGFRVHPGGVQALYGVRADITTYGKAVANGMPVGVVAGSAAYLDAVDGGSWQFGDASLPEVDTTFFAGTFFRHPLVMAAVLASLRHIKEQGPQLQESLNARTSAMAAELNAFFAAEGMPLSVTHFGSLFLLTAPPDVRFMDLFYAQLLLRGIYVWERRVCYLSTAHTDDDIRRIVDAYKESARELQRAGFLPGRTGMDGQHGPDRHDRQDGLNPDGHRSAGASNGESLAAPAVAQTDITYPLTEAQRELWTLAQLGEAASVAYNLSMRVHLKGALHDAHLGAALQTVVDRHEALRANVDAVGARQTIAARAALPLQRTDLSALAADERTRSLLALSDEEARRPFDLTRGPLLRAHLVKEAADVHTLVLTAHHIVVDGQSLGMVLGEVAEIYAARVEGRKPRLAAPTPFRAYADELMRRDASGEMAEAGRFWLDHLHAPLTPLELPLDRPRPPLQTYAGDRRVMTIDAADAERIRALAQQLGCTPFMVLLAAVKVLLHRLTDRNDIVVAVPAAGQPLVGSAVVGHCVNVLPLRSAFAPATSFSDLARAVKATLLDAYEQRAYPFSRMVKHVEGAQRDRSRPPLAAVMFNLDHGSRLALHGLDVEVMSNPNRAAQFELEWNVVETPTGFDVECFYNIDLFDASTVDRWQASLRRLLGAAAADPAKAVDDLDLLGDDERSCLLDRWNQTCVALPPQCIHALIDEQADRSPTAVAVASDGHEMSYGELRRRSDAFARVLIAAGVQPEQIVALLSERSESFLIAMLGILKAGAAYLPLDPHQPSVRHRQVLASSGARWLIAASALDAVARETIGGMTADARPALLLLERGVIAQPSADIALPTVDATQLAYVIYTSGSTGVPKGAMVVHGGVLNHLHAKVTDLGLTSQDRVAQTASQSFDISVWQLLAPLLTGGRVQIYGERVTHAPADLLDRCEQDGVTALELVPAQLRALLDELDGAPAPALTRLRWLLLTGEALPPDLCGRWLSRYSSIPIVNAYGPTECSDDVTHEFVRESPQPAATRVPIGRPIANTRLYVLDEHLQPRPIGVPGELYVAGRGVGRGYRNDAAQTAAAYLPDPFAAAQGRMYRTGDLVRWLPDGSLEYLRRLDDQVKLRGFRIELGDVEAALRRCEGVRDGAVAVRNDSGQLQLVAYVVAASGAASPAALRRRLQEQVPRYMVPAHFVAMDSLPRSANGKLDRTALPAPDAAAIEATCEHVAPRTAAEHALATIWSDVLRIERPGVHDNFFECGGDSILAIQMVARARREGLMLSAADIFEHQTIGELAAAVRRGRAATHDVAAEAASPLTPIQRWFFDQHLAHPQHWNMPAVFDVAERLDRPVLTKAVRAVVAHHDALRTRFPGGSGLCDRGDIDVEDIEWIDQTALAEADRESAFRRRAVELQKSLDVEHGPLMRAAYFDRGPGTPGRLLWIAHHLAVDIVSWRVLAEDLTAACRAIAAGETFAMAPSPSQSEWAQRLAGFAGTAAVEAETTDWLRRVEGVAALPEDGSGGGNTHGSVRVVSASLDPDQTATLLREAPRRLRARIGEVLATALQTAAARWTGRNDLLIDVEGHGREALFEDVDVSRTVGWFTAIYPVRLVADAGADVSERLRAVKEAWRAAPHGGIGYGLLRYLRGGSPSEMLERAPQAQVVFNYRGESGGRADDVLFRRATADIGPSVHPDNERRYLLEIDAAVTRGRLELHIAYSTARHCTGTVQRLADDVLAALGEIARACRATEAAALSPVDFPRARTNGRDLNRLISQLTGANGRQA